MFRLGRSRVALVASLFPTNLLGKSQEFPLNILAGVFASGDEAVVGGDECECVRSAIASATKHDCHDNLIGVYCWVFP